MSSTTTRISLAPSPGFCVKSSALNTTALKLSSPERAATLPIPINLKVFINIAWDKHVPAPPDRSEAAIERAIAGDLAFTPDDPDDWYVPVIVPEPRPDKDKAGKPSVVFDCIFSASLKSRALRSPEFKTFLIELAFQRIEAQYGVQLSRQIGTPNIASKGKLAPRTVLVPTALLAPSATSAADASPTDAHPPTGNAPGKGKPLIEEVAPSPAQTPKGILKTQKTPAPDAATATEAQVPALSWSKTDDGRLRIALSVPHLTHALIPSTTLDLEPRRILFSAPSSPSSPSHPALSLDLDLSLPDAQIERTFSSDPKSARAALELKRQRQLDVDGARAEWRVKEGALVIYA